MTFGNGYNCVYCGQWVTSTSSHFCSTPFPNPIQREETLENILQGETLENILQGRIATALERIADHFERREGYAPKESQCSCKSPFQIHSVAVMGDKQFCMICKGPFPGWEMDE